jgi:uncharacterized protein (TIGR02646 family)
VIHKNRNHLSPPETIKSEGFKQLIERLLKEKNEHDFEKHRTYIRRLSKDLILLYNNKCGYCETRISTGSYIPMDHYRPKRKLKEDDSHPGYYWLGYEWTNLVPACPGCNNAKSTHFPIDKYNGGERVKKPPMDRGCLDMAQCQVDSKIHMDEKPLLLHPEVDRPEEHLVFSPDGKVEAKDESKKGKNTILICKLNRTELMMARKGVIDRLFKAVVTHLIKFCDSKDNRESIKKETLLYALNNELIKIKRAQEPHHPYSRLGWFLFEKFETFFIQRLESEGMKKSALLLGKAFSMFPKNSACQK